jgi:Bacterial regulatory helix-turn-helix protein, lysR family
MTNIQNLDLNLLVVLEAIYSEGGVTRAAEKLNLTQPAISHALSRLRATFADPLFFRQGRALVPTPLTRSLIEPLRRSLRGLGSLLNEAGRFDPHEAQRTFTLAMRDPVEILVLPPLLRTWRSGRRASICAPSRRRGATSRPDWHRARSILHSTPHAATVSPRTRWWSWRESVIRGCAPVSTSPTISSSNT